MLTDWEDFAHARTHTLASEQHTLLWIHACKYTLAHPHRQPPGIPLEINRNVTLLNFITNVSNSVFLSLFIRASPDTQLSFYGDQSISW